MQGSQKAFASSKDSLLFDVHGSTSYVQGSLQGSLEVFGVFFFNIYFSSICMQGSQKAFGVPPGLCILIASQRVMAEVCVCVCVGVRV